MKTTTKCNAAVSYKYQAGCSRTPAQHRFSRAASTPCMDVDGCIDLLHALASADHEPVRKLFPRCSVAA